MDFNIFTCLLVLFIKNSQGQSYCNSTLQPVVKVCSDQEMTNKRAIYIDTFGVQNRQHISCDCVITPARQHFLLNLNLINPTGRRHMNFKINDIEVGNFYDSGKTPLRGATKLLFSTLENRRGDGVCLAVYSVNGTLFNISCTRAKRETTTQASQSSTEHRSETTKYETTLRPTRSSTDKGNEEKNENVTKRDGTKIQSSPTTATRQTTMKSSSEHISQRSETEKHTTLKHSTPHYSAETNNGKSATTSKRTTTKTTKEKTSTFSSSSMSQGIVTTRYTSTMRSKLSTEGSGDNAVRISIVLGSCGFVSGLVSALVCAICYRRKMKEKVTTSPKRQSTRTQAEGDYYMTENPMYNMSPNCIIGGNIENDEHHNVAFNQQNVGASAYSYETIQETLEGKNCPDYPQKHAVTYDYAVCNVSKKNNGGEESSRPTVKNKPDDSKSLSVMATDETIYNSTKEKSPKQPPGLNDYHHLTPCFTGKCLTYDTIENTSVSKS